MDTSSTIAADRRLSLLERAIYSTVAYRDIFQYPVTLTEIHRYLHRVRCTLDDVREAITRGPLADTLLEADGTYFALRGRRASFDVRRRREALTRDRWPTALRFARFLATLPNVRMVAVTGSFAANNFAEDGDIDFLLVSEAGSMWRTRALGRVLSRLDEAIGRGLLCPNTVLSTAALPLPRQSLYDAQELCQMIPLFGSAIYETVRTANAWTADWLPNAEGWPEGHVECVPYAPGLKLVGEWLLDSMAGRAIETFEAERKIRRFNETADFKEGWTRSTRETHSMWDGMRLKIERAWRERLAAIGHD